MNNMRKQVRVVRGRGAAGRGRAAGPVALAAGLLRHGASKAHSAGTTEAGGGPQRPLCNRSTPVLWSRESGVCGCLWCSEMEALPPVSPRSHSLTNPPIPSNLEKKQVPVNNRFLWALDTAVNESVSLFCLWYEMYSCNCSMSSSKGGLGKARFKGETVDRFFYLFTRF